jgi:hypothetical protein
MRYEIVLSPEAIEDLRGLKANWRATVRNIIKKYFYILLIYKVRVESSNCTAPKSETDAWLEKVGEIK